LLGATRFALPAASQNHQNLEGWERIRNNSVAIARELAELQKALQNPRTSGEATSQLLNSDRVTFVQLGVDAALKSRDQAAVAAAAARMIGRLKGFLIRIGPGSNFVYLTIAQFDQASGRISYRNRSSTPIEGRLEGRRITLPVVNTPQGKCAMTFEVASERAASGVMQCGAGSPAPATILLD
jgi:hypothetical protein